MADIVTGEYCPMLTTGLGFEVSQRLNDLFSVDANVVQSVLRYAHSKDPSCVIGGKTDYTLDEFMNLDGMKRAISEYFGEGESTFVLTTKEEYDNFAELYKRFHDNGYIDDAGFVTNGGLQEASLNEITEAFTFGLDSEPTNALKFWHDASGKLHVRVQKPVLKEKQQEDSSPINIYAGSGENVILSNFAIRPFTIDGLSFPTVEHYFQFKKAEFAGDLETGSNILFAKTPAQARSLGRKVIGLDVDGWDEISSDIMENGIYESFVQNYSAKKALLDTGDRLLTHNQDTSKWKDEFPRILMMVRDRLRSGERPQMFTKNGDFNKRYERRPLVTKVISGIQTGVDTLGLVVAHDLGIETGGTATPGFVREKGIDSYTREDFERLGVIEISEKDQAGKTGKEFYLPRTRKNVLDSDGTVYFATDADSSGLKATQRYATQLGKPFIVNPTASQLRQFIIGNNIQILNVAGNRGSKFENSTEVETILREGLLEELKENPIEKLSREELPAASDFYGLSPSEIEHNKAIMKEAYEKSLEARRERLEKIQQKETKNPIEAFRNKFTDKNMLNFLAEVACRRISNIVTELQDDAKDANGRYIKATQYFKGKFSEKDFTNMSRKEILLDPEIWSAILDVAKVKDFSRVSQIGDEQLDEYLEMIYDGETEGVDNYKILLQIGRRILRSNEDLIIDDKGDRQVVDDQDDNQEDKTEEQLQADEGEGNDVDTPEQFKLATPEVPASQKITKKIKLMLANIPDVSVFEEEDGSYSLKTPIDPWGFGFPTFLDPGRAVNTILNILTGADTIEEMIERLRASADGFPWLNNVLSRIDGSPSQKLVIDKEKMRNDFFASFRKDKTIFTSTIMTKDVDGIIQYRYAEKNRGANARKLKNNIAYAFEAKSGIPLFKNGNLDFSGGLENNPLLYARWYLALVRSTNDPRDGKLWRDLNAIYDEDPDSLYEDVDRTMRDKDSIFYPIYNMLKYFGIECSPNTFYAMAMSDKNCGVEHFGETTIGKIATKLYSIAYQLQRFNPTLLGSIQYYNPMDYDIASTHNGKDYVYIRNEYSEIIDLINAFTESPTESVAHVAGKAHYAFNYPTFMQTTIAKLSNLYGTRERLMEFFKKRYDNEWYSYIGEDGKTHYYLDILEKIHSGRNSGRLEYLQKLDLSGVDYKDMSPRGYAMSILSDYFTQADRSTAVYRAPIASDKPAMDGVRWIRYSDRSNTDANYKKVITDQAWNIFLQEIDRSRRVIERAASPDKKYANFDIKIDNPKELEQLKIVLNKMQLGKVVNFEDLFVNGSYLFKKSGVGFKVIRAMQEVVIDNKPTGNYRFDEMAATLRQAIIDSIFNGKNSVKDCSDQFAFIFENFMNDRVMQDMKYLKSIGVFEEKLMKDEFDSYYKLFINFEYLASKEARERGLMQRDPATGKYPKFVSRDTIEAIIEDMIEEFSYNNFIMQAQMAELFGVDLAFYNGTTDFQKRSAQTRSTGQKLNKNATIFGKPVSDGVFRTVTVNSPKHVAYEKDDIESVLRNYAEDITDPQEQTAFTKSIPGILSLYDDVDDTDGQAWNCLSSLRKKHIMAAKWSYSQDDAKISKDFLNENSDTDEAVYRRMKLGLPLAKDFFHVFTQIDKPFVYDVSQRDGFPVPLQQKNSEYTYVLVNQFMSTKRDDSAISVLINKMEETHSRGSIDRVDGIDTANFDSAVKVGTSRGIDLSMPLNKLRDELDRVFHLGKYETGDSDDLYEQDIDEIDVDSYAYQQVNPEHFIDHHHLLGSQMKILSLANTLNDDVIDIQPDDLSTLRNYLSANGYDPNIISGKDLKSLHFDVLTQRARLGEKMLREELGLDSTDSKRQEKLSQKLKKSLAVSRKYGVDDIRAVSIAGRNFLLSPEDPTQAANIKSVTASWVRKALYRQEVLGGPIVQATDFGQNKELKTVIKNNRFEYFETIIPMPKQVRDLLIDEDTGEIDQKFYNKNEGVWNFPSIRAHLVRLGAADMLNVLLYRIPTEGKYSIFPCKVVGFAPNGGGDTVWLPSVGTTIAGFDFDTDKLFCIMKEFAAREDKLLRRNDNNKVIQYTPEAKSDRGKMAGYNNLLFDLQWLSLTTPQSSSEMFDPGNFEDLTKLSYQVELLRARKADMTPMFSVEEIKEMSSSKLRNIWNDLNDLDVTSVATMVQLHNQNMSNKDMLGIAAVANIAHAQISMFTKQGPDDKFGYLVSQRIPNHSSIEISWTDRLGRKRVHEIRESTPMDQRTDWNGELISKYLRKYIGAAADGAKNPTLSRLGVDKVTFPVIQWMLRAGIPMEIAHLYTSLPIFKRLSSTYSMMNDDKKTSVNGAINKLQADIFYGNKNAFGNYQKVSEYRNAKYKDLKGFYKPIQISIDQDDFIAELNNPEELSPMAQFHLLEQFRFLSKLSNTWTTFSDYGRINSVVAGPKSSIEENDQRASKVGDIMSLFVGPPEVQGITYQQLQDAMPYETQMRDSIIQLLEAIQGDLFPSYQSDSYNSGMRAIEQMTGATMTPELKERYNRAQKMIALSIPGEKIGGADFIQLYDDDDAKHYFVNFVDWYTKELEELKQISPDVKANLDNNLLLTEIGEPTSPNTSCPIKLLNTEIFGADETFKYKITQAWQDLIDYNNEDISKEDNERIHNLGLELFRYFTLRNGAKDFDAKTPWHLTPLDLKIMIPGYNERLRNIQAYTVPENLIALQFILNNARNENLVPRSSASDFGITEFAPKGVLQVTSGMLESLLEKNDGRAKFADGSFYDCILLSPIHYLGDNTVLILGDKKDVQSGSIMLAEEDFLDGVASIQYHIVPAMGIPNVMSEYYPYLRNSTYGYYLDDSATFIADIDQDVTTLADFEQRRNPYLRTGIDVNQILLEVLSSEDFGVKLSDVINVQYENFSVSRTKLKNYLRLSDAALLQRLGFKKRTDFRKNKELVYKFLNKAKEAFKKVC